MTEHGSKPEVVTKPGGSGEPEREWKVAELLGQVIEQRYELEELLVEGGMGAVFAGKQLRLGRRVAIKIVHPRLADNPEVIARFEREVEANARLDHPNIVAALDCGTTENGSAYLVMQLAEGRTLSAALNSDGALPWRRACELGLEIAEALTAAHEVGVIHRDVKPSNVVLVPDEEGVEHARLLDFGIARFVTLGEEPPDTKLTKKGEAVGTVGYMAPEQALSQSTDTRADLYSLGVVLFEMLTGEALFDPQRLTITSYVASQLNDVAPSLADVMTPPLPPKDVIDLVAQLLVSQRDERPREAQDVRDRLRRILTAAPEQPSPPSAVERALAALDRARTTLLGLPPPKLALLSAGAGALAIVGLFGCVGLGLWLTSDEPEPPPMPVASGEAPAPKPTPTRPRAPIEAPMSAELAVLLNSDDWRARREAARTIWEHEPRDELDPFTINVASLEMVADCEARARVVERLGELEDTRALEPLRRHRRDRCRRGFAEAIESAERQIRRANP